MQNSNDLEHLRWLRIGFLINAGSMVLVAVFRVIHLDVGVMVITGYFANAGPTGHRPL